MKIRRLLSHVLPERRGEPTNDRSYRPTEETTRELLYRMGSCGLLTVIAGTIGASQLPVVPFGIRLVVFLLGVALSLYLFHRVFASYVRAVASNLSHDRKKQLLSCLKTVHGDLLPAIRAHADAVRQEDKTKEPGDRSDPVWEGYRERYGVAYCYWMSMLAIASFACLFLFFASMDFAPEKLLAFSPFLFLVIAPFCLAVVATFRIGPMYYSPMAAKNAPNVLTMTFRALRHFFFHGETQELVGPTIYEDKDPVTKRRIVFYAVLGAFFLSTNLAAMFFPMTSLFHVRGRSPVVHDPVLVKKPTGLDLDLNDRFLAGEPIPSLIASQRSDAATTAMVSFGQGIVRRPASSSEREKNIRDLEKLEQNQAAHIAFVNEHPTAWMLSSMRLAGTENGYWLAVDMLSWLNFTTLFPSVLFVGLATVFLGQPLRFVHSQFVSSDDSAPEHIVHQRRVQRARSSLDASERKSVIYGYDVRSGAAFGQHIEASNRVVVISGKPGSGKTQLANSINQQEASWISKHGGAIGFLDMKGDEYQFQFLCELGSQYGLPVTAVSLDPVLATHVWNPIYCEFFLGLSPNEAAGLLTSSLALSHGLGHGESHYGEVAHTTIGEALTSGEFRSFRELYPYVLDPKNYGDHFEYRDAAHARNVIRTLSIPHVLNATPELVGDSVFKAQFQVTDLFRRGGIFYFHFPVATQENVARYAAKLLVKSAFAAKKKANDDTYLSFTLDEGQAILSGHEMDAYFQMSRTLGIRTTFTCQSTESLVHGDVDLFAVLRSCATARFLFSVTTPIECEELDCFNPRVLEENIGIDAEGAQTVMGLLAKDKTHDDYTAISDTNRHAVAYVTRDESPFSQQWHGTIREVKVPFCISPEDHKRLSDLPWPTLPGSFRPSDLDDHIPPPRSSASKDGAPRPPVSSSQAPSNPPKRRKKKSEGSKLDELLKRLDDTAGGKE